MGWILLLLVIIICVGTYINSRNEKKKQSQLCNVIKLRH